MTLNEPNQIPLGKTVGHSREYNPDHLFPVPRVNAREEIGIKNNLPFSGLDIWNSYELSWLDSTGKPVVAICEILVPCTTENIIESKSLKLYLNSFNQSKFDAPDKVKSIIENDLSRCANGPVTINIILPKDFKSTGIKEPEGLRIDDLNIETSVYNVDKSFLKTKSNVTEETLYSDLLRTNCPVTQQPDWATVVISYKGPQINHSGLLKYIISFREHTGFHENCVEKIFMDIKERCNPEKLTVYARFTRRGGIDINPCRSSEEFSFLNSRLARQ